MVDDIGRDKEEAALEFLAQHMLHSMLTNEQHIIINLEVEDIRIKGLVVFIESSAIMEISCSVGHADSSYEWFYMLTQ